jgi:hypothetical protein
MSWYAKREGLQDGTDMSLYTKREGSQYGTDMSGRLGGRDYRMGRI